MRCERIPKTLSRAIAECPAARVWLPPCSACRRPARRTHWAGFVTVSAFAAVRQAGLFANAASAGELPYALHGRLAGGMLGTVRFSDAGVLRLPAMPGWWGG